MEIRQRHVGPVACLDLVGRLIQADQDSPLRDKVNSLLFQGHLQILLNLKEISVIDTSGLATMIAVKLAVQRKGGDIKLLNLPARVHNMLVVTRLITLFDVFESESDAVRSFSVGAGITVANN